MPRLNYPKKLFILAISLVLFNILSSPSLLNAQDLNKLEELTRKIEELNKQIEACGDDIGCMKSKMAEIQKLSNEIRDFQKNHPNLEDEIITSTQNQYKLPPGLDKIVTPYTKHVIAISILSQIDCNEINDTRLEVMEIIDELQKTGAIKTNKPIPLPLTNCEETTVRLTESGKIDEPGILRLEYELEFTEKAAWLYESVLLINNRSNNYEDKYSYKLGYILPNERRVRIKNFRGWVLDQSKNPPIEIPLNRYKVFRQDITEIGTHVPSYEGYTLIYPDDIAFDETSENNLGEVVSYRLKLPHQMVRFYSDINPDLYIDNSTLFAQLHSKLDEKFTPEELQLIIEKGEFSTTYSAKGITQKLEIGIATPDCDSLNNSTKGAIVRSGDCIDHGGFIVASDNNTIVNGKPVARIGDKVICYKHGGTEIILNEKNNVTSNKKRIARIGDMTKCGARLIGGSLNTFIGNK